MPAVWTEKNNSRPNFSCARAGMAASLTALIDFPYILLRDSIGWLIDDIVHNDAAR